MKKAYTQPKAEKVEFTYQNTIVASIQLKDGKTGHAANACYTGNTNDVYTGGCEPSEDKQPHKCSVDE